MSDIFKGFIKIKTIFNLMENLNKLDNVLSFTNIQINILNKLFLFDTSAFLFYLETVYAQLTFISLLS